MKKNRNQQIYRGNQQTDNMVRRKPRPCPSFKKRRKKKVSNPIIFPPPKVDDRQYSVEESYTEEQAKVNEAENPTLQHKQEECHCPNGYSDEEDYIEETDGLSDQHFKENEFSDPHLQTEEEMESAITQDDDIDEIQNKDATIMDHSTLDEQEIEPDITSDAKTRDDLYEVPQFNHYEDEDDLENEVEFSEHDPVDAENPPATMNHEEEEETAVSTNGQIGETEQEKNKFENENEILDKIINVKLPISLAKLHVTVDIFDSHPLGKLVSKAEKISWKLHSLNVHVPTSSNTAFLEGILVATIDNVSEDVKNKLESIQLHVPWDATKQIDWIHKPDLPSKHEKEYTFSTGGNETTHYEYTEEYAQDIQFNLQHINVVSYEKMETKKGISMLDIQGSMSLVIDLLQCQNIALILGDELH
ncbi:hypothetical protein [Radiobacillus sp. PE A8.2]|uniref:hypothetical protein n=1 Tax=Radiobacillus sp. PE A8.2 TaxID=3380349 RepID=UPI00388F5063